MYKNQAISSAVFVIGAQMAQAQTETEDTKSSAVSGSGEALEKILVYGRSYRGHRNCWQNLCVIRRSGLSKLLLSLCFILSLFMVASPSMARVKIVSYNWYENGDGVVSIDTNNTEGTLDRMVQDGVEVICLQEIKNNRNFNAWVPDGWDLHKDLGSGYQTGC